MSLRSIGYLLTFIAASAIIAAFLWNHSSSPAKRTERLEGKTMGTTWSAVFVADITADKKAKLQQDIEQQLALINRQMSTYDRTSEISRFNDSRSTDWFTVSPETAEVVELSDEISRVSNGAFDVTVAPLVDLWGFGPKPRSEKIPSDNEINRALHQIGYRHLLVRHSPPAVKKSKPELRIDLSAVAKGYAVDKLAEIMTKNAIHDMVVEIGGEMRISGRKPNNTIWRIAIEKPEPGKRAVERVFLLTNTGVATSGNYRNFFEKSGERYGHTIDTVTGRPVLHKLASVTVLAPQCARADALATALMALGEVEALALCKRENIAAYLLIHQGNGLKAVMTDAFRRFQETAAP